MFVCYIVTKATNNPHSRNFKGMDTSFRRNDLWYRLGGQAIPMIGEYTTSSPPFFLRDSRASETRARVKITPREEKWGTTRSLISKWLP